MQIFNLLINHITHYKVNDIIIFISSFNKINIHIDIKLNIHIRNALWAYCTSTGK